MGVGHRAAVNPYSDKSVQERWYAICSRNKRGIPMRPDREPISDGRSNAHLPGVTARVGFVFGLLALVCAFLCFVWTFYMLSVNLGDNDFMGLLIMFIEA